MVVVGLSGLRWSDVSAAGDADPVAAGRPGLGRQPGRLRGAPADLPGRRLAHAERGRPGAVRPHQRRLRRLSRGRCRRTRRQRPRPARAGELQPPVPQRPDWGLLAASRAGCATAVGPGAALALAGRAGHVASYLPRPDQVSAAVLARCPLTVVDLGTLGSAERTAALAAADAELARIVADAPRGHDAAGHRARRPSASRRTCSSPWSTGPVTGPACSTPPPPGSRAWSCSPT